MYITGWSFVFVTQVVPSPIAFSHCWRCDDQLIDTWRHAKIDLLIDTAAILNSIVLDIYNGCSGGKYILISP